MSADCPFHGTRLREWSSPLVHLSETTYGHRQRTTLHAHVETTLAFVVSGAFTERQGSRVVECGPAGLLLRPAGIEHDDAFADQSSACFNIVVMASLAGDRPIAGIDLRGGLPAWLATRLLLKFREAPPPDPLTLEAEVAELVSLLSATAPAPIPARVRRVTELLHDELSEGWSLKELDLSMRHCAMQPSMDGPRRTVRDGHFPREGRVSLRRRTGRRAQRASAGAPSISRRL
jgi:hypothetical protein